MTGLWQVKRSRNKGEDFQEWIRYDIEYVENRTWRMDFYIIFWTLLACFGIKHRVPLPADRPDGDAVTGGADKA